MVLEASTKHGLAIPEDADSRMRIAMGAVHALISDAVNDRDIHGPVGLDDVRAFQDIFTTTVNGRGAIVGNFLEGEFSETNAAAFMAFINALQENRKGRSGDRRSSKQVAAGGFGRWLSHVQIPMLSVFGGDKVQMLDRGVALSLGGMVLSGVDFQELWCGFEIEKLMLSGALVVDSTLAEVEWARFFADRVTFERTRLDDATLKSGSMLNATFRDTTVFGTSIGVAVRGSDMSGLHYDGGTLFRGMHQAEGYMLLQNGNANLVEDRSAFVMPEPADVITAGGGVSGMGRGPCAYRPPMMAETMLFAGMPTMGMSSSAMTRGFLGRTMI